jgi:hypothetical protein
MIAVITILLVVGFGAALLGLPVRIFKGRKRDWGEPYYDLDGRECRPEEMAVVLPVMEGLPAAIEIRTAALMREQNAVR